MNTKTTLAILILAIVLAVLGIMKFRSGATPAVPSESVDAARPLLDAVKFNTANVTAIDLKRASDDSAFRFEKGDNDAWQQTAPIPFDMEGWQIEGLATDAAGLKVYQTVTPSQLTGDLSLDTLALNPPTASLTFTMKDGSPVRLDLGRMSLAGKAYARLDPAGDVFLVDDTLHKRVLQRDPREWRIRSIFSDRDSDPAQVSIQDHDAQTSLVISRVDSRWRMLQPVSTHLDPQAVDRFVNTLQSASIRGWVVDSPDSLALYGLDNPARTISLRIDKVQPDSSVQSTSQTLLVGSPIDLTDKSRYAKRAERKDVFTISGPSIDQLNPKVETLISKSVLGIAPAEIRALDIKGQGGSFRLERTTDSWSLRKEGRDAQPADPEVVEHFLTLLTTPRNALTLGALPADGPDAAMAEVAVEDFNNTRIAFIKIAQVKTDPQPPSTEKPSILTSYDAGDGVLRTDATDTLPALNPDAYVVEDAAPAAVDPSAPAAPEPSK